MEDEKEMIMRDTVPQNTRLSGATRTKQRTPHCCCLTYVQIQNLKYLKTVT